jgi:hypothetical protein
MKSIALPIFIASLTCLQAVAQTPAKSKEPCGGFRAELEKMRELDQANRVMPDEVPKEEFERRWKTQKEQDALNQSRLAEIVDVIGWPKISDCGQKASSAAFLIVQHSPPDVMTRYHPMLEGAMRDGDIRKQDFALFDDRVRMNAGRPQLYGSQLRFVDKEGKRVLELWRIDDEVNVDARRAAMGLGPLAAYVARFGLTYAAPEVKQAPAKTTAAPAAGASAALPDAKEK